MGRKFQQSKNYFLSRYAKSFVSALPFSKRKRAVKPKPTINHKIFRAYLEDCIDIHTPLDETHAVDTILC